MNPRLFLASFALGLAFAASASSAADQLVLNGAGMRTKPILGAMYELALYVPAEMKGAHPKAIVEDARPMELVLTVRSSMITRPRFVEATSEGFAKAAKAGYPSPDVPRFLAQFDSVEFRKGDVVSMRFENGGLVTLFRKAESKDSKASETQLGRIPGIDLKRSLFAIWLGDVPAQESLKKELLGLK